MPGGYFVHNGQLFREGKAVISPDNRSFRYGDGLFETMRVLNGNIILKNLHFERLLSGMKMLGFDIPDFFTASLLEADIMALCKKNRIEKDAIIRLNVFRSDGGLYDLENMRPNYIIQSMQLASAKETHTSIAVDIYPDFTKACNPFSQIKSNNFLIYVMAVLFAKQTALGDALIINQYGRVAESTISNIFIIKHSVIFTPPLSEGCVAGVARSHLLHQIPKLGFEIAEKPLTVSDLLDADEVFLTNVVKGIRPVAQFREKLYHVDIITKIRDYWNGIA